MQRLNFTLDNDTVELLETLAQRYYSGNKSQTVRAALESLSAHVGHDGWIISGYSPVIIEDRAECHTCHSAHDKGEVLYRPVFERGSGVRALPTLPKQLWLDCSHCVEQAG